MPEGLRNLAKELGLCIVTTSQDYMCLLKGTVDIARVLALGFCSEEETMQEWSTFAISSLTVSFKCAITLAGADELGMGRNMEAIRARLRSLSITAEANVSSEATHRTANTIGTVDENSCTVSLFQFGEYTMYFDLLSESFTWELQP